MKQINKFLAATIICCFSITSFAQFNPVPMTVCEIVLNPVDELDVVTIGTVTDVRGDDQFELTYNSCTVLCDGDIDLLPLEGMFIVVEGRIQEEDLFEDLAINVRYWIPYFEPPPEWPDPVVFTAEDAANADEGTIALLFGNVHNYSDEDEGLGLFQDSTGTVFIDFPDGDSPDVQQNVHVLGVIEINNFGNPQIDVTYWYPEDGNPPPDPPAVAWSIEDANTLPVGSFCLILGMVTSWTNETLGEGVYDDGTNSMNIDFESDIAVIPNLDSTIFVMGKTGEDMDIREIEAHFWFPEDMVGIDDPVALSHKTRIYPNPARSTLNIDSEDLVTRIVVYSIHGKMVKEIIQSRISMINVSELNPGVYILSMYNDNRLVSYKKLIVK